MFADSLFLRVTDLLSNSVTSCDSSLEYRITFNETANTQFRTPRFGCTTETVRQHLKRREREKQAHPSRWTMSSPGSVFAEPMTWIRDWHLVGFEFGEADFHGFTFPPHRAIPERGIAASAGFTSSKSKRYHVKVPCWFLVLPVTLASSWLLFRRAKKSVTNAAQNRDLENLDSHLTSPDPIW